MMTCRIAVTGSKPRRVEVRFDDTVDYGSPEHFYHFMWGYLLPAVHEILGQLDTEDRRERFVFTSCGPKMDPLIAEVAGCLGIRIAIEHQKQPDENAQVLVVPRWDLFILRPHLVTRSHDENIRITRMRHDFKCHLPEVWERFTSPDFIAGLRPQVTRVREALLRCAEQDACAPSYDGLNGRYLILRREEEHPFYAEGGGARLLHYGAGRRALTGIDDAARVLEKRGFEVSVLVAGAHSLMGQALAFHRCRGIAMIRGAEIANLIWVRPGTPLLVLTPSNVASFPPPHDQLTELMDVKLTQVFTEENNSVLDPDLTRQAWAGATAEAMAKPG